MWDKDRGGGSLTLQIEMLKSLYNGLSVRSRYFILGIRVVQVKVMLYVMDENKVTL